MLANSYSGRLKAIKPNLPQEPEFHIVSKRHHTPKVVNGTPNSVPGAGGGGTGTGGGGGGAAEKESKAAVASEGQTQVVVKPEVSSGDVVVC